MHILVQLLIAFYLATPLIFYVILPYFHTPSKHSKLMNRHARIKRNVAIVVLGDLGHSPRMCNHALSFARANFNVELCGYVESNLAEEVVDNISINVNEVPVYSRGNSAADEKYFIIFALKKIVFQVWYLFKLLFNFKGFDYILIQNPPNIPIFLIVLIYIKIFSRSTELIIDWHNLGYTILSMKYNNDLNNPLVKVARLYECILGSFADYHLTVTNNMKEFLISSFKFKRDKIFVLYDRANSNIFKPIESEEKRLDVIENSGKFDYIFKNDELVNCKFNFKRDKVIITSTSFTPDEDLALLLTSLRLYDIYYMNNLGNELDNEQVYLPKVFLIITGKGPLQKEIMDSIKSYKFSKNIIIKNYWLSYEDYSTVLSLSNLGISLHTSSSGLDLPMKVLDMFGTGLPVIALNFKSLSELVKNGENGFAVDLKPMNIFEILLQVFTEKDIYERIKNGAMKESETSWNENWINSVSPIIHGQY